MAAFSTTSAPSGRRHDLSQISKPSTGPWPCWDDISFTPLGTDSGPASRLSDQGTASVYRLMRAGVTSGIFIARSAAAAPIPRRPARMPGSVARGRKVGQAVVRGACPDGEPRGIVCPNGPTHSYRSGRVFPATLQSTGEARPRRHMHFWGQSMVEPRGRTCKVDYS